MLSGSVWCSKCVTHAEQCRKRKTWSNSSVSDHWSSEAQSVLVPSKKSCIWAWNERRCHKKCIQRGFMQGAQGILIAAFLDFEAELPTTLLSQVFLGMRETPVYCQVKIHCMVWDVSEKISITEDFYIFRSTGWETGCTISFWFVIFFPGRVPYWYQPEVPECQKKCLI